MEPSAPSPPEQTPSSPASQSQAAAADVKTDILGIISLVLAFFGMSFFGLIVGIVGAHKAKKEGRPVILSRIGWIINLVLTILAVPVIVLAFLALPALQRNTRNAQRKSDVTRLQADLQEFYSQNRYYPATLSELRDDAPLADSSGQRYAYDVEPAGCSQCTSFTLSAVMEGDSASYTVSSSSNP